MKRNHLKIGKRTYALQNDKNDMRGTCKQVEERKLDEEINENPLNM